MLRFSTTRSTYLYTAYYNRYQPPSAKVQPRYLVRGGVRSTIQSASAAAAMSATAAAPTGAQPSAIEQQQQQQQKDSVVEWPWYGAPIEDIAAAAAAAASPLAGGLVAKNAAAFARRAYVPLADVLQIEMRGDHLVSGGMYRDALKHYGVVLKAKQTAYLGRAAGGGGGGEHLDVVKARIKLARAFRLSGMPESAVSNLEVCLAEMETLSTSASASSSSSSSAIPASSGSYQSDRALPSAEQYCEVFLELGLAKRDLAARASPEQKRQLAAEAGALLEDCARIMHAFHDLGGSHRGLRLLSRAFKSFNLNAHNKFTYYAPRDWDRTFALVDSALEEAEAVYRGAGDRAGVARVLETRVRAIDAKAFNSGHLSGRVRTWHGHNHRKTRWNTSAPSATELLAYSPTLHQPYHDFSRASIAPVGREDEVMLPAGARVLDDGDPFRHLRAESKSRADREAAVFEFLGDRDARATK